MYWLETKSQDLVNDELECDKEVPVNPETFYLLFKKSLVNLKFVYDYFQDFVKGWSTETKQKVYSQSVCRLHL